MSLRRGQPSDAPEAGANISADKGGNDRGEWGGQVAPFVGIRHPQTKQMGYHLRPGHRQPDEQTPAPRGPGPRQREGACSRHGVVKAQSTGLR